MLYWLANILPYWMFYLVPVVFALLLVLVRFVPVPIPNRLPITYVLHIFLCVGLFLSGYAASHSAWQLRAQQLQAAAQAVEQQAQQATAEVQTRVVTKTKIVRERGENIVQYIDREVVKHDNLCEIPTEIVDAHNKLVEAPK